MTTFNKPAVTVDEHLALLQGRGLFISDTHQASLFLETVSFFRLSIYMRPFQIVGNENHSFKAGTDFNQILDLYAFDRELRLLVMDAIETVEVALRASLNNHMSCTYQIDSDPHSGSHWYLHRNLFKQNYNHSKLISDLETKQQNEAVHLDREKRKINASKATTQTKQQRIAQRSKDNYPRFYQHNYQTPALMPGWAMTEELSLGNLSYMYKGLKRDSDRKAIARRFNVHHEVLASWLHTLTFVRNCCAHHSRLWNRELSVQPKILQGEDWQFRKLMPDSQIQPNRRIYIVLILLAHLIRQVSPHSQWPQNIRALIRMYPNVHLAPMGFTCDWKSHIFWSGADA